MIKEDHTVKGEFMARLKCPKCETELDEIIRVIEIRCRYDKQDDDYLTQREGERFVDCCPKCRAELDVF